MLLLAFALVSFAAVSDPPIPADTEIKTTASGLQYSILKPGREGGRRPELEDIVEVNYYGWLVNGKLFDSSEKRGKSWRVLVGEVIEGWNEGLQLMTEGAKFKLTIPAELGYGKRSNGRIPANATLIYVVELLEVIPTPDYVPINEEKSVTTDSGLKYEIVREGDGESPVLEDIVEIRYAFWGPDGKLMRSSVHDGVSSKGPIQDMGMPFLKEALVSMKPGSARRFEVPPDIGYGERSVSQKLPANSITHWYIELIRVIEPLPVPPFADLDPERTTKTASGLEYEILEEGDGRKPKMGELMTVHYAGWLPDGTNFDSSFSRGEASQWVLGNVIAGWNEGLQLMPEGSKFRFRVPSQLGYGARGLGDMIPPNTTLIFYVDLISIDS